MSREVDVEVCGMPFYGRGNQVLVAGDLMLTLWMKPLMIRVIGHFLGGDWFGQSPPFLIDCMWIFKVLREWKVWERGVSMKLARSSSSYSSNTTA